MVLEIKDFERLMFSLTCVHLASSTPDARVWSLTSVKEHNMHIEPKSCMLKLLGKLVV